MTTVRLTDEQRAVVDAIAHKNNNAIVNAVAGSGKTRTALAAACEFLMRRDCKPQQRALLVVYNKRLQQDMYAQMRAPSTPCSVKDRIEVRTIHGLGHRYFGGNGLTTDRQLCHWTGKCKPVIPLPDFGLMAIDEAQDLTPVLFSFLHYVMSFLPNRPRLLILGDPFQLLYRFNGAQEDYLLDAASKFADVAADVPFSHFKLSICFRITHEMAAWINSNLNPNNLERAKEPYAGWFAQRKELIADWWGEGIRADPARPPSPGSLIYLERMKQPVPRVEHVVDQITSVFKEYDSEHSALISPSIVANDYSPVRILTNTLTTVNGTPQAWFFDISRGMGRNDNEQLTSEIRKNKRVASTIHKFKGRECDAIVLVGLDAFAEKVEKRDPSNVFNMFYVGATRARKLLLIIQWNELAYATHLSRRTPLDKMKDVISSTSYPVLRILDYCPYDTTLCEESSVCLVARDFAKVPPCALAREHYVVPGTHCSNRYPTLENVSSIIAVALEVKLQMLLNDGRLAMPDIGDLSGVPTSLASFLQRIKDQASWKTVYNWAEILQVATALLTLNDRLYSRWRQIQDFPEWPVVAQSHKLYDNVMNLVHLLYLPFCEDEEDESLSQISAKVGFDEKLARLKQLWAEGRFMCRLPVTFSMTQNSGFVQQYGEEIGGVSMVIFNVPFRKIVLSGFKAETEREKAGKKEEGMAIPVEVKSENGEPCAEEEDVVGDGNEESLSDVKDKIDVTVIVVKATSDTTHDDLLEVGCYGAMWRDMFEKSMASGNEQVSTVGLESEKVRVKMFVVYPILGVLKKVELHMNPIEFLHRVGFRKLNLPFDEAILTQPGTISGPFDKQTHPYDAYYTYLGLLHMYTAGFKQG